MKYDQNLTTLRNAIVFISVSVIITVVVCFITGCSTVQYFPPPEVPVIENIEEDDHLDVMTIAKVEF